jgi:hypothetical protein
MRAHADGADVGAFVDFGERRHSCYCPSIASAELKGVTRARQQLVERNWHSTAAKRNQSKAKHSPFRCANELKRSIVYFSNRRKTF